MAAPAKKKLKVNDDLTLNLPTKLPFAVTRYVDSKTGSMDIANVLDVILGEDQAEKVWDLGLDIDAGTELVEEIIKQYEVDSGK